MAEKWLVENIANEAAGVEFKSAWAKSFAACMEASLEDNLGISIDAGENATVSLTRSQFVSETCISQQR